MFQQQVVDSIASFKSVVIFFIPSSFLGGGVGVVILSLLEFMLFLLPYSMFSTSIGENMQNWIFKVYFS